jgi:hypothetical protein
VERSRVRADKGRTQTLDARTPVTVVFAPCRQIHRAIIRLSGKSPANSRADACAGFCVLPISPSQSIRVERSLSNNRFPINQKRNVE